MMNYLRLKFQNLLWACGVTACAAIISIPAMAVPVLQLGINNGTYDASAGEESTVTSENIFDLYALGKESSNKFSIDDVYHISAALTPKTGFSDPGDDFGTFDVSYTDAAGVVHTDETIAVTADMTFGIPPLEANWTAARDPNDLANHDIFDTYFYEFSFRFDAGSTVSSYNTQDGTTAPGVLLRETFSFDLSDLQLGYDLHFDLYRTKIKNSGDFDIDYFAPFSHDAGSARTVPTPATWLLFLVGLGGLLARRARD